MKSVTFCPKAKKESTHNVLNKDLTKHSDKRISARRLKILRSINLRFDEIYPHGDDRAKKQINEEDSDCDLDDTIIVD